MLIIQSCFSCPNSAYSIKFKYWHCLDLSQVLSYENLEKQFPEKCKKNNYVHPINLVYQTDDSNKRFVRRSWYSSLSVEAVNILEIIFNSPSEFISLLTPKCVRKKRKNKNKEAKLIYKNHSTKNCHICKRDLEINDLYYQSRTKPLQSIFICQKCMTSQFRLFDWFTELVEQDRSLPTKQDIRKNLRKKGFETLKIDKVFKEITSFLTI